MVLPAFKEQRLSRNLVPLTCGRLSSNLGSASETPGTMSRMPLPPASPPREFESPVFPTDDQYERICQIGQGTFGVVYKAKAPDQAMVALKALRIDDQHHGFSVTSVREIRILQRLSHDNIIPVCDVVASKDAHLDRANAHVYIVFPYLEHDLSGLLNNPACRITTPIIKCYFKQIVTAVAYLHENGILHRDLKCSNILINNEGIVKLCDFGLARPVRTDNQPYTDKVCTLWYRAPELLLGERHYGPPLDIWSLGCVFAEMLTLRPLFHGSTEMEQLDRIFKLCGTPSTLPSSLPMPNTQYPRQVKKTFSKYGVQECDLLDKMLQLNPENRITAAAILEHPYFTTSPLPVLPEQVPKFTPSNELSAARRKNLPIRKPPGHTSPVSTTTPAAAVRPNGSESTAKRPRVSSGSLQTAAKKGRSRSPHRSSYSSARRPDNNHRRHSSRDHHTPSSAHYDR